MIRKATFCLTLMTLTISLAWAAQITAFLKTLTRTAASMDVQPAPPAFHWMTLSA